MAKNSISENLDLTDEQIAKLRAMHERATKALHEMNKTRFAPAIFPTIVNPAVIDNQWPLDAEAVYARRRESLARIKKRK